MTNYFINTWYVENVDGTFEPVANLATARHLLSVGQATKIVYSSNLALA
jgi:hypothetical protein